MFSVQQLLEASFKHQLTECKARADALGYTWAPRRNPDTVMGFMNREQVNAALNDLVSKTSMIRDVGVSFYTDDHVGFMSDDMAFARSVLPREFCACTFSLPMKVSRRDYLPTGIINSAEELMAVFYPDIRLLTSLEELVEYLNTHYQRAHSL